MKQTWLLFALALASLAFACGGSSGGGGGKPDGGGAGGSGGSGGGSGGSGGYDAGPPPVTTKLDLLFMIDNSISMGDKQALLAQAVPRLIQRLVTPPVDPKTGKPVLAAVTDLHIGVITSSLGGHGGDQCSPSGAGANPTQDDKGHLLPSVRPGVASYQSLGFLWWDPGAKAVPPGESNVGQLANDFSLHVTSAGEVGCGFESQLESWYRFLVDPSPPGSVVVSDNLAKVEGVDDVVLQQRKDFLRADSAVVIVMLTDENDCSVVDGGYNWVSTQLMNPNGTPFHLARGTAACLTDPNSPCCRSCSDTASAPPAGCSPVDSDPECVKGLHDDKSDHPNLRCWQQKRRFGAEFLYPTRRYAEALTQPDIYYDWNGFGPLSPTREPNALLENRDRRLVFLAGIVGVPWQDLATPVTLADPAALELSTASELASSGRWDWLTPKCATNATDLPVPISICDRWDLNDDPDDPFMIESPEPRTGKNPATGLATAPPSAGPMASPINGHEWNADDTDLQYACILPLATPKDCAGTGDPACNCKYVSTTEMDPVCQDPSGQYGTTQYYAKAFPGVRQLQVLRDLGDQAVVASICPKSQSGDPTGSAYGYNAAMNAVVARLATVMPAP